MSESTWSVDAPATLLEDVNFGDKGLIPVIAQDATTLQVLMLAWMDREALERTLREGRVTYFSRSRGEYWRKGDQSGHIQHALRAAIDCDGDTLLLQVDQHGPACHTGTTSCFDQDGPHD
jgi:phosphoribosyl-AMP cyclohydrolase